MDLKMEEPNDEAVLSDNAINELTKEITTGTENIHIGSNDSDEKNYSEEYEDDDDEVEMIEEDEDISGALLPRDSEDNEEEETNCEIDYRKYADPQDIEIDGGSISSSSDDDEDDDDSQYELSSSRTEPTPDETSSCSFNSENTNELECQDSQEGSSSKSYYSKHTSQSVPYNFKLLTQELTNGQSKFMENFDPERSNREKRKLTRKMSTKKATLYDDAGLMGIAQLDICDCMSEECPGCHFPCPKCFSNKCGHECRQNRRWLYEEISIEGTDEVIQNSAYYSVSTESELE